MAVTVARAADVPEGERTFVRVNGSEIAILNISGEYYAIKNYCPHMEGPLGQGNCSNDGTPTIRCPWHCWEFNLKTGEPCFPARKRVSTYDVREEDGDLKIEL